MRKRCPHTEVEAVELFATSRNWCIKGGVIEDGWWVDGNQTGEWWVTCTQCHKAFFVGKKAREKNLPRWVSRPLAAVYNRQDPAEGGEG